MLSFVLLSYKKDVFINLILSGKIVDYVDLLFTFPILSITK